jgi:hypothetical protein
MDSGHETFLAGVALLLLGLFVTIPAVFGLNLVLAYVGVGVSIIGSILFVIGIHIFMRETTVEVRDILGIPSPNQTPAGNSLSSEDTASRRLDIRATIATIFIIIVFVVLLLAFLFFFVR